MLNVVKTILKFIPNIFFAAVFSWLTMYIFVGKDIVLFTGVFFVALVLSCSHFLKPLAGILSLIIALIIPSAKVSHGNILTIGILDTIVSTNLNETLEFYLSLPFKTIILGIISLLALYLSLFFARCCRKSVCFMVGIVACVGVFLSYKITLAPKLIPIYERYETLNTTKLPTPTWSISSKTETNYQNFVLIIGESLRKDMMSLYGCQYQTTPFIDQLPKKYISNYISTAINTTLSVPRLLSITNQWGEVSEQNNIISLAKLAGLKTHWLSAQGYSGRFDISSSRIANYADIKSFKAKDDFDLIPLLRKTITNSDHPNLIIMHLQGSHEHPCHRLKNWGVKFSTNKGRND